MMIPEVFRKRRADDGALLDGLSFLVCEAPEVYHAQSARLQHRVQRRADTSLPVRAGHVQRAQRDMRIAKRLQQRLHALQAQFPLAGGAPVQKVERVAIRP